MTFGSDALGLVKKIFLVSEELTRLSVEVKDLSHDVRNHEVRLAVIENTLSICATILQTDPSWKLGFYVDRGDGRGEGYPGSVHLNGRVCECHERFVSEDNCEAGYTPCRVEEARLSKGLTSNSWERQSHLRWLRRT